jgi:hypothetical protein
MLALVSDDPRPILRFDDPRALLPQAFELFFNPEIVRRRNLGLIDETFGIMAAQVVFHVDAPAEVRFNDEVMGSMLAVSPRDIEKGEEILWSEVKDSIKGFDLADEDQNAAHITIFYGGSGWTLISDGRFNLRRAIAHCDAAEEYLETAAVALQNERIGPFAENLYAAVELAAKGALLTLPDERMLRARSHNFIASEHNLAAQRGFVEPEYVRLHNRLRGLRKPARYLSGPIEVAGIEAKDMLSTARRMLLDLRAQTQALRTYREDEDEHPKPPQPDAP